MAVRLFPADGRGLHDIYGTRGETLRALAARQLCRPRAQGVVAEAANTSESKEESKPREERKEGVTVRKIRIIKKN